MTTEAAAPVLTCPDHGVIAVEDAVFVHTYETRWTARLTGETRELQAGVDDDGDDLLNADGNVAMTTFYDVAPVEKKVNEDYMSFVLECPHEECGENLEGDPRIWHVIDQFEDKFYAIDWTK